MVDRKISDMHAWVEERLSAFLDDQLGKDERAQVESHLRDCARCRTNLESLRWTVSLLKQVPASALPRSFTLPVGRGAPRSAGFSFAFLRGATALATLVLCLVVGLDLFSRMQFVSSRAIAPAPQSQFAAPTQNIALAPPSPAVPSSAPAPTQPAPQPLSQSGLLPTPTIQLPRVGAAEALSTPAQADNAKSAPTVVAPAFAPRAALTATMTPRSSAIPPSATPLPSATGTLVTEARVQPTPETPPSTVETISGEFPLIRLIELGLLALAIVLGILTIRAFKGQAKE